MKLKIDNCGRISIPKALRERLGIKLGTELEVLDQQNGLLLRIAQDRPALVRVDGLWVHQGRPQAGANWDRIVQDIREERVKSILMA